MKSQEMEARIKELENQVRTLQDIEEIRRLQKSYGYFLQYWMAEEIIALFSDDPDVSLTLAAGTYVGQKSVANYFNHLKDPSPEFMHQVMQLSGIVTVAKDGKTAKGRWYGFGAVSIPSSAGVRQIFMGGIYNGEYVREDEVWKFKKLRFDQIYTGTPAEGWVKPERLAKTSPQGALPGLKADIPRKVNFRYPSGKIVPFHYKHPVTGKASSEKKYKQI